MSGLPRNLLRLEGLAVAAGALVLYFHFDYSWLLLVVLALAPDLWMIGFLAGPRIGTLAYNLAHTEVWPVALGVAGIVAGDRLPTEIALIWLLHIGVDRMIGYGLKYPTAFKDTHLQRV